MSTIGTYNRENILSSVLSSINPLPSVFGVAAYKTVQTDFMQENIYPVIYVIAGQEDIHRVDIGDNFESNMDVLIRIVTKAKEQDDSDYLSPLVSRIIGDFTLNSTISGTVFDARITNVRTDEGILYPYALAELTLSLTYRFKSGTSLPLTYP